MKTSHFMRSTLLLASLVARYCGAFTTHPVMVGLTRQAATKATTAATAPLHLSSSGLESLDKVATSLLHQAEEFESGAVEEREAMAAQLFESIDQDRDGELSFKELRCALESALREELAEEETEEIMECFKDNLLELAGQIHLLTSGTF